MANHQFNAFDPEQTQALITAVLSLSRTIEDTIAATADQFKNALVTSDTVLGECEYKDETATALVQGIADLQEDLDFKTPFDSFSQKIAAVEQQTQAAFNRNTQNNADAMQNLKSQAKKAGAVVAQ